MMKPVNLVLMFGVLVASTVWSLSSRAQGTTTTKTATGFDACKSQLKPLGESGLPSAWEQLKDAKDEKSTGLLTSLQAELDGECPKDGWSLLEKPAEALTSALNAYQACTKEKTCDQAQVSEPVRAAIQLRSALVRAKRKDEAHEVVKEFWKSVAQPTTTERIASENQLLAKLRQLAEGEDKDSLNAIAFAMGQTVQLRMSSQTEPSRFVNLTQLPKAFSNAIACTTDCKANAESINRALGEMLGGYLEPHTNLEKWLENVVRATQAPPPPTHYTLKRDVYEVKLTSSPRVRVQCDIRNNLGSDNVVFDPQEARGLVRHAILPDGGTTDSTISCTSDHLSVSGKGGGTYFYDLEPVAWGVTGQWTSASNVADQSGTAPELRAELREVTDDEKDVILRSLTTINPQSTLRSIDPSSLATDLISALSTIALDRAEEAAKHYARNYIMEHLCSSLTVGKVIIELKGSPLANAFQLLPENEFILPTTCSVTVQPITTARRAQPRVDGRDEAKGHGSFEWFAFS